MKSLCYLNSHWKYKGWTFTIIILGAYSKVILLVLLSNFAQCLVPRKSVLRVSSAHHYAVRGDFARNFTHDEWLISLESLKILLLNLLKPFQLKHKFLNKISVKQNAKKPLIYFVWIGGGSSRGPGRPAPMDLAVDPSLQKKIALKQTTKSKLKTSIKKLINCHQKVFKKFEFELKW